jgi:DNA-directed RNA polymerase beta subunit
MVARGYHRDLDETLTSGITGEEMEAMVLVGMPYYLALRHFARDKIRSRNTKAVSTFSRQPVSGSEGGGLRIGEMEVDCLLSHGSSSVLSNMSKHSDSVTAHICEICGRMDHRGSERCVHCGSTIVDVPIPYSLQLTKYLMDCCGVELTFEIGKETF